MKNSLYSGFIIDCLRLLQSDADLLYFINIVTAFCPGNSNVIYYLKGV